MEPEKVYNENYYCIKCHRSYDVINSVPKKPGPCPKCGKLANPLPIRIVR